MEEKLLEAIQNGVAYGFLLKNGTTEEKERFVSWACSTIDYLTEQIAHGAGDNSMTEGLHFVQKQYNAYLRALNDC